MRHVAIRFQGALRNAVLCYCPRKEYCAIDAILQAQHWRWTRASDNLNCSTRWFFRSDSYISYTLSPIPASSPLRSEHLYVALPSLCAHLRYAALALGSTKKKYPVVRPIESSTSLHMTSSGKVRWSP